MKTAVLAGLGLALSAAVAHAVPILQVGAPGTNDGFALYSGSLSNPTEGDSALTGGNTLLVGGSYGGAGHGNGVALLGGQYTNGSLVGDNWSSFGLPGAFDRHGAILVASVPEGVDASSLRVNGLPAFFASSSRSSFPNNHAPVKAGSADFLFFDIGDFVNAAGAVPDFADPGGTKFNGEVKEALVAGTGGLPWIHWDVMALESTVKQKRGSTTVSVDWVNNPASHDATWKPEPAAVPEPETLVLLGSGLLGLGGIAVRRGRRGRGPPER